MIVLGGSTGGRKSVCPIGRTFDGVDNDMLKNQGRALGVLPYADWYTLFAGLPAESPAG